MLTHRTVSGKLKAFFYYAHFPDRGQVGVTLVVHDMDVCYGCHPLWSSQEGKGLRVEST